MKSKLEIPYRNVAKFGCSTDIWTAGCVSTGGIIGDGLTVGHWCFGCWPTPCPISEQLAPVDGWDVLVVASVALTLGVISGVFWLAASGVLETLQIPGGLGFRQFKHNMDCGAPSAVKTGVGGKEFLFYQNRGLMVLLTKDMSKVRLNMETVKIGWVIEWKVLIKPMGFLNGEKVEVVEELEAGFKGANGLEWIHGEKETSEAADSTLLPVPQEFRGKYMGNGLLWLWKWGRYSCCRIFIR